MDDEVTTAGPFADTDGGAELRLCLTVVADRIATLRIDNRRPAGLLEVLRGHRADGAPDLVRRLFPICGSAHALACAHAIAAARGIALNETDAERLLLYAELAVAHGWRSLIDWRTLLALPPRMRELRRLVDAAEQLRGIARNPGVSDERRIALQALADALQQAVFGDDAPRVWPAESLYEWAVARASPLHEMLRAIRQSPLATLRPPQTVLLGTPAAAWFAARLSREPDFGRWPSVDGLPAEVGAYAECTAAERGVFDAAGPIAARLLAMLGSAAALLESLREAALGRSPAPMLDACATAPGSGCAVARTVRGPLAYWVRVDGERIADLRAVAPTEWALHPRGSLRQVLLGLPALGAQALVRLAAAAFDPCAVLAVAMEQAHA